MCGICGFIAHLPEVEPVLSRMLDLLKRRGPDSEGRWIDGEAALGMRRLAIIDIDGGKQPFVDTETGTVLIFNGEIYNFRELKKELANRGHIFFTESDGEVALRSYLAYGEEFASKLNGMFAIAIWEPKEKRLTLCRDQLGQKPLYLHSDHNTITFASTIDSLLASGMAGYEMDIDSLVAYLSMKYVPGPNTIIKGIEELPPGHMAIWQRGKPLKIRQYWQPVRQLATALNETDATEEFWEIWQRVISRHMISDVPVGLFLSGGIDSSLIACAVAEHGSPGRKMDTFSVGFACRDMDETHYASEVASSLGFEHHIVPFEENLDRLLDEWGEAFDQPFSDPAALPLLVLSRVARGRVTVALTGDGGDELFCGYKRYINMLRARKLSILPMILRNISAYIIDCLAALMGPASYGRRLCRGAARRIRLIQKDAGKEYIEQFFTFDRKELFALLDHPIYYTPRTFSPCYTGTGDNGLLFWMLDQDLRHWLPAQMLVKTDRVTMYHSLEARLPFLDMELVEFALRLPPNLLYRGTTTKYLLRRIACRHLPRRIAERGKHGLSVPIDTLIRENQDLMAGWLSELTATFPFFNKNEINRLFDEHRSGRKDHGEKLVTLLSLAIWAKKKLENRGT